MGLLDRWTKKNTQERLSSQTKKEEKAVAVKAEPKAKKTEEKKAVSGKPQNKVSYRVIISPLVTEKAAVMQSQNKYSFLVARWAKKVHVKTAIAEMYGVEPIAVNIINAQGHRVRFGRSMGRRSDTKKAIITLKPGENITIHEGV